ncbi:hypothetical protein B296_00052294 [Ensete ventricosum]|uniref:Uncharacterized protein n=1 Tax=Ensete ventricosum TaxID=4639 RepID=A0A426X2L2_ENSVE|nr:hypothetical protein B296_00052294 [Ensete ventricosum]
MGLGAFAGAAFARAFTRPKTTSANVLERWRLGRRPGWGISLEIYSGETKDAKVAATIAALAGRSCPTAAALHKGTDDASGCSFAEKG